MSTAKQVTEIAIEVNTYDGTFTPVSVGSLQFLSANPTNFPIWNIDPVMRTDWQSGSSATRSLPGFDRANPGGFRASVRVSLRNTTPTQSQALRNLLNEIFVDQANPYILRVSPDTNIANGVYCNIQEGEFGFRRQLTVAQQFITLNFVGVRREGEIPDSFRIG